MKTNNKALLFASTVVGFTMLASPAFAGDATPENRFGLGLSIHTGSMEYKDNDTATGNLFPIYRGERINVDDGELAFNFLPDSSMDLEALLKRQHFGYESGDANVLEGLEDRHQVWGVGARLTIPTGFGRFRAAGYFNPIDDDDVKDAESGSSLNLEYGFPVTAGGFQITPMAGVHLMSEEVVDFLYGVSPTEATNGRTAFQGEDATVGYIGVEAEGMVSQSVRLTGGLRFESLPDEIANSPLVEEDSATRAYFSVAWMF